MTGVCFKVRTCTFAVGEEGSGAGCDGETSTQGCGGLCLGPSVGRAFRKTQFLYEDFRQQASKTYSIQDEIDQGKIDTAS